jgi:hypothetical protein
MLEPFSQATLRHWNEPRLFRLELDVGLKLKTAAKEQAKCQTEYLFFYFCGQNQPSHGRKPAIKAPQPSSKPAHATLRAYVASS